MAAPSEDWAAVLEQLLAGDAIALAKINRLISAFLAKLQAYDFRGEWGDLRQEVVLALVANSRAGRLRSPEAFVAYVRALTRNKFYDRLKTAERRRERETLPLEAAESYAGQGPEEGLSDIALALAGLPPEERQVVAGVVVQGKTYREVSREASLHPSTMKRRLKAGLDRLRQRLS